MERDIAIVNFGMGNLFSVKHACLQAGLSPFITHSPKEILGAPAVILPGVGAFGEAMKSLRKLDLVSPLKDIVAMGKPFMGICLGMQLLMTESYEFGHHTGLDIVKGKVLPLRKALDSKNGFKIPHVGWNAIEGSGEYMYFIHSYYVVPQDGSVVTSTTSYGGFRFCAALQAGNVFAFQFHPERSGLNGLKIYFNFSKFVLDKNKENRNDNRDKKQMGTSRTSYLL